jgi:hypothetical protein
VRRIYDAVIVASAADLDLLEARFTEFAGLPVTHVIAECPADYQGNPKPLHFLPDPRNPPPLAARWHGRWNHVRVEPHELPPLDKGTKARKDAFRDYLAHGTAAEPDDIVLHGSVDEIPSARTIAALLDGEAHLPVGMEMRHCAYRADLVHPKPWRGTVAQEWRLVGSFAGMRERRLELPAVVDAGTRLAMWGQEPQEFHPDGHALWPADVDDSWPRWVTERARLKLSCYRRYERCRGGVVLWLAWTLSQGPGTSVTPVDSASSSVVGYLLGYGPIGVAALALAWLTFKGWRLMSPAREDAIRTGARAEARADLEKELARTIARAEHAEDQRDEALRVARDQMVPLLSSFTSTTGALIPLLQEVVRAQEGRNGGR